MKTDAVNHLLLMYLHAGQTLTAHTGLIMILAAGSVIVICGFLWRGWRSHRRPAAGGDQQFPTNLLEVFTRTDPPAAPAVDLTGPGDPAAEGEPA